MSIKYAQDFFAAPANQTDERLFRIVGLNSKTAPPTIYHFVVVAALLTTAFFILFRYPNNSIGSRPRPDLPGPKGLPLIGNLLLMIKLKDPHGWQLKAQQKFGPGYSFTLPGLGRLIDVSRPDWIEHVQKTNFNGYVKGESFHHMMRDVLGSGIFNVDGDQWKTQRKLAARIFTVKAFSNIITSVMREDTAQLDRILAGKAKSGEAFNIQDLFFRFTLSTFVKIAFKQDTGILADADKPDEFGEAFNYAQKVLDMRFVKPFWAVTELFNERGRKMRAARKVIDDFTDKIVGERLKGDRTSRNRDDGAEQSEGLDLLDLFITYRSKSGLSLDAQSLKDAILNLMIAGRDTTAEALSWMTWRLVTSPETLSYVKTEIEESQDCNGTFDIEYEDLKRHPRKTATLYETLRLHPSIPKNIRRAVADDVLPNGGPRIERGDIVLYSDWTMGRNKSVWGPDAQEFIPSRWIDENGSVLRQSPSKAHFFSAGPRACLGSTLATFEVCQVINLLFGKYDVELVELGPKLSASADTVPEYLNSLTHPMKRPLMVKVKKL